MKNTIHKDLYADMLEIMGSSYVPTEGLDAGIVDDPKQQEIYKELTAQNERHRNIFLEDILPRLQKKINEISKNLKEALAIEEGKSTDQILGETKND